MTFDFSSIYPSPLNDSGISTNTDSLPDLSNLQFTSSLGGGSLLDGSDQVYSHSNSMALGSQHVGHIGPVRTSQQNSPGSRHRQAHAGPTPLVLYGSSPSHSGVHGILPQVSYDACMSSLVFLLSAWCGCL